MDKDLDGALARLALEPPPPALLSIEEEVLARIRSRGPRSARAGLGMSAITAVAAVAFGFAAAAPAEPTSAAPTLSPFGPDTPLAPSTLLAADR